MHSQRTSFDLLAHFDQPKTSPLQTAPPRQSTRRSVRWVLKWAIAIAMLVVAASILTDFAYMLAAEHRLNAAARAALSEVMLPRATTSSVQSVVEHRLGKAQLLQLTILQNGHPAQGLIRQSDGDRFAVSISLASSNVIPKWSRILNPSHSDSPVFAHAEGQVPGRTLSYKPRTQTAAE